MYSLLPCTMASFGVLPNERPLAVLNAFCTTLPSLLMNVRLPSIWALELPALITNSPFVTVTGVGVGVGVSSSLHAVNVETHIAASAAKERNFFIWMFLEFVFY